MSYFPEIPVIEDLLLRLVPFLTHDMLWQLIRMVVFPGVLFTLTMIWPLVWIERKMWGRIHDRRGPTHVGFRGFLQLIADFIKLLNKETIIPRNAHKLMFRLAPALGLFIAVLAFSLLPFDENWALYYTVDPGVATCTGSALLTSGARCHYINYDLLLLYALLTAIPVLGLLAGWAAGSKYPIIGSWRFANQQFAVEIPLLLSTVGPVLLTGSLSFMVISQTQISTVWFVFLLPLSFITFVSAGIASVGRWPFDIHEADSEIVVGYRTEFAGALFMLSYMTQYVEIFLFTGTAVALWLGGGQLLPFIPNSAIPGISLIPPAFIFVGKMLLIYWLFIIVTNTLHRVRMDQILRIMWRILLPLTLLNILGIMLALSLFPGLQSFLGLI